MIKGSTRWYYINELGKKVGTVLPPGETPPQHWIRGFAPMPEEQMSAHIKRISALHRGVPKTITQREKMRAAKLNKPKTPEHCAAMSRAHKERTIRIYEVMRHNPHLTYNQCSSLEAKLLRSEDKPDWFIKLLEMNNVKD